uniref:Solute carrier family 22 member 8 n=1 Tax=Aceria tosichella TaxID=561515 RepID=A0A6G1SK15_9ACAR
MSPAATGEQHQDETQNGTTTTTTNRARAATTTTAVAEGAITNQTTIQLATNDEGSDVTEGKFGQERNEVQLSDFIGEHGPYQLALSILLFVRYVLLGLMANSGPLMTPDVTFYCHLPMQEILFIMPNISTLSPHEQELEIKEEFKQVCQIDLHLYQNQSQLMSNSSKLLPGQSFKTSPIKSSSPVFQNQSSHLIGLPISSNSSSNSSLSSQETQLNHSLPQHTLSSMTADDLQRAPAAAPAPPNRIRECTEFTYQLAPNQGRTVTSEFNLVCDDDWLRSLFQSLLSAAIVVAHVFWGTFSDKYGRFQAQRICLVVSLFAGTLSIFAWDFWSFTLLRALCSFGDLGLVVSMTTTMVELVGSKYRGLSVALINFGYALGVSLLPYLVAYCQDFRLMVGLTVLWHMITMPFVLATNESIRWLLTNRKHELARRELKRIMRWNHNCREIWPSNCRRLLRHLHCPFISSAKPEEANGQIGQQHHHQHHHHNQKPALKSALLLEQKHEFQLKFEQFIQQLECQNLCDPNTSETDQEQQQQEQRQQEEDDEQQQQQMQTSFPAHNAPRSPAPASPRPQHRHQHQQARPPTPASRFEPLLRPELPVGTEQTTAGAPLSTNDVDEIPLEQVKPRLLGMVEIEHIQLIRELESSVQQTNDSPRPPRTARSRTLSRGNSSENHEQQRSQEDEDDDQDDDGHWTVGGRRHSHLIRQQQCQPDCINMFAHQLSFVGRVSRLFRDKKLMIATFTIVWTTFNSELLYTSFIIINLYAGEDVYLNYVIGGCAEALAAIVASLLLSYSPRRLSLIAFWLLISFSCFGLSLAHIDNIWAVWLLALAKFSQSCLSSIASVAAYESFPTFLRQSGSGLVFTLGMMGSVFAPLIFAEFDDHAGMDRVLIIFSISSLTAALLIYMFLKETRDCELM